MGIKDWFIKSEEEMRKQKAMNAQRKEEKEKREERRRAEKTAEERVSSAYAEQERLEKMKRAHEQKIESIREAKPRGPLVSKETIGKVSHVVAGGGKRVVGGMTAFTENLMALDKKLGEQAGRGSSQRDYGGYILGMQQPAAKRGKKRADDYGLGGFANFDPMAGLVPRKTKQKRKTRKRKKKKRR